jgi:hypothetical protein
VPSHFILINYYNFWKWSQGDRWNQRMTGGVVKKCVMTVWNHYFCCEVIVPPCAPIQDPYISIEDSQQYITLCPPSAPPHTPAHPRNCQRKITFLCGFSPSSRENNSSLKSHTSRTTDNPHELFIWVWSASTGLSVCIIALLYHLSFPVEQGRMWGDPKWRLPHFSFSLSISRSKQR